MQAGVFNHSFPGVIMVAEDAMEAVIVFLYIKGLRHKDMVTFRGFMFAQVHPCACHVCSYGIARKRPSVCSVFAESMLLDTCLLACGPLLDNVAHTHMAMSVCRARSASGTTGARRACASRT